MPTQNIQSGVFQWKFTSCGYNIDGYPGFSTFSMSEGLTSEDKDDLVKFAGGYSTPEGLPLQPVTEEELDLFPVAFASFKLRSGKRAVTRTRYVGKDYRGARFGNLFSHGLILPENADWNFHPIQLWDASRNSTLWTDGLTEEEQHLGRTPEPLPLVDISEEQLRRFDYDFPALLDHAERFDWFKSLLAAVQDRDSNKSVLLRDEQENIVQWLAAVQYAFPVHLAQDITFQTYCRTANSASQFHVAGTCLEGHSFQFRSPNLTIQFFPFDFASGTVEPHTKADTRFSSRFSREQHPSEELQNVYQFAEKYDILLNAFDDSLGEAVLLYDFFTEPHCSLSNTDFETMLKAFQKLPANRQQILEDNVFFTRGDGGLPENQLLALIQAVYFTVHPKNEPFSDYPPFDFWFLEILDNNWCEEPVQNLFEKLPNRYGIAEKMMQQNKLYHIEQLKVLLPLLFPIVQNDVKALDLFTRFLIKHFEISLNRDREISDNPDELETSKIELFSQVYDLFHLNRNWTKYGCWLLNWLKMNSTPSRLTFYFYLCLALSKESDSLNSETAGVMRSVFQNMDDRDIEKFYRDVLPAAVKIAESPDIHLWLIALFAPRGSSPDFFYGFAVFYLEIIKHYGTKNWRDGKEAKPQANAFMRAVFKSNDAVRWFTTAKKPMRPTFPGIMSEVFWDGLNKRMDGTWNAGEGNAKVENLKRYWKNIKEIFGAEPFGASGETLKSLREHIGIPPDDTWIRRWGIVVVIAVVIAALLALWWLWCCNV
ncbi:hypothetical protein FACS189419_01580 [Planctomycetales bacterium]|nr:hypothetical protein FACS189419_01580 [Planctomycetales bacterium]